MRCGWVVENEEEVKEVGSKVESAEGAQWDPMVL